MFIEWIRHKEIRECYRMGEEDIVIKATWEKKERMKFILAGGMLEEQRVAHGVFRQPWWDQSDLSRGFQERP